MVEDVADVSSGAHSPHPVPEPQREKEQKEKEGEGGEELDVQQQSGEQSDDIPCPGRRLLTHRQLQQLMIRVNVGVEVRIVLLLFPLVQASGRRTARQLGPCKSGTLKCPHDRVSVARGQTRKRRQPRTRHHPSKAVVLLPTRKLAPTCSSKDPPRVHFQAKSRSIRNIPCEPASLQAARRQSFVSRPQDCPVQQKKDQRTTANLSHASPSRGGGFQFGEAKTAPPIHQGMRRHREDINRTKYKPKRSCTKMSTVIVH